MSDTTRSTMSPEAQRVALAEWAGRHRYVKSTTKFNAFMEPCCDVCGKMEAAYPELHVKYAPDYLNDLNAVHELESRLDARQQVKWESCLCGLVGADSSHKWTGDSFKIAHATAAQRSEAILRTLGLWKEGV